MTTVTIYGCSDDLIEVDGDIVEEFNGYKDAKFLHFDSGQVIMVQYTQRGVWKIDDITATLHRESKDFKSNYSAVAGDPDSKDYTDKLVLTGPFKTVECWSSAEGPTKDDLIGELEDHLDHHHMRQATVEQLKALRDAFRNLGK